MCNLGCSCTTRVLAWAVNTSAETTSPILHYYILSTGARHVHGVIQSVELLAARPGPGNGLSERHVNVESAR